MKQFFKFMFASMLGTFLILIVCFFLFIGILVSMISFSNKDEVKISNKSVLHIKLENMVSDRSSNNPFQAFNFNTMKSNKELGLNDILANLKKAKTDPNIKGIYLDVSNIPMGISLLEEIRNGLIDFKKSGKFIISYSEMYSQKAYYLASVSDKIYLNKEGSIDFHGLAAEIMFFKGLMQKLDVDMQIIRHGKFKSAVEPFLLDKMSDPNREQTRQFIGSIWNHIVKGISESRNISIAQLQNIADSLLVQSADDALKYKFVDELVYKDQLIDILRKKLSISDKEDIDYITLSKYEDVKTNATKTKFSKNKIAIIYAVGAIEGGKGNDQTIGSEKISEAIRNARIDNNVKAIVLRVNSPGGDALASDVIWREVMLAKKAKPVVVSMGDYAASGGYYIACAADKIIANPTTITGSIGVFGMIPNLQKMFNNKLGITFDTVLTNKNATAISGNRPLSTFQEKVILNQIERIYGVFIAHVAEGRKMTIEQVDNIGQGRVWSGFDAKRIGLVDDFGGIDKAIEEAAKLAKLTEYKVIEYPKQKEFFQQIMEEFSGENATTKALQKELGENYVYYQTLKSISSMKGIQARLPYVISLD
ncbi:MAG: signal peptide peptidase SppA [Bacteroidetes bacterium]|nr:signal peptide peptidase SppA [Bacteroidota bacterium]